jgi:GNAT superfamily N-acetyltransferase
VSVATFIEAFASSTAVHPFRPSLRVWQLTACFEISVHAGRVSLDFVQALFKGHGDGSRALDWVVGLAREHEVTPDGRVQRCGTDGLSKAALRAWYARHGFHVRRDGHFESVVKHF